MTELLRPDAVGIARAAALLRKGLLVAFGTETVYGLGADATNDRAVAAIFAAKERPRFNPLICHYADDDAALADVIANDKAWRLATAFWPGPLTLVLARRPDCAISLFASGGLDTLAVRVPEHCVARALLLEAGVPVAAPSANRSGRVSPTTAQHVLQELSGRIAAVLESGLCAVGVESTVLDVSSPTPVLLRPGGVTVEAIEDVIGKVETAVPPSSEPLRSPGMLAVHYAPRTHVRCSAVSVAPNEALLAFGAPLPGAGITFNLSERSDLAEAASRLFTGLRKLDEAAAVLRLERIAVMPVPDQGLGRAINDRLRRAASPRMGRGVWRRRCGEWSDCDDDSIAHPGHEIG
ncbi:MAG TPA: L-threonylcarbamoyladenylate synthase [Acetobacteraceae bacterium]|jgi:L-threonylcarbamoyladenylate synthase|nr:L-threonylcarbamoyladenylate synthase [Acetobacteraceae bacterium]